MQELPSRLTTIMHYNLSKVLWIDPDALKKFGFRIVAFYTAANNTLPESK